MTSFLRRKPPRVPSTVLISHGINAGKPVVIVTVGKSLLVLDGDGVERLKAELDAKLVLAREMGET